jgi:hypothetical protein
LNTSRDYHYNAPPLYGDFSSFRPIDVFTYNRNICFPLSPPFDWWVRQAGVSVNFCEGHGMMHVWPYISFALEYATTLDEIIGKDGDA